MNAVWSSEQQRLLMALGYTLYRPAGSIAIAPDASIAALDRASTTAPTASAIEGYAPRHASSVIEPLLRALLRAGGSDPGQVADAESWLRAQQIPSLTQLRNNPAAKRALWPRLRALRRQQIAR